MNSPEGQNPQESELIGRMYDGIHIFSAASLGALVGGFGGYGIEQLTATTTTPNTNPVVEFATECEPVAGALAGALLLGIVAKRLLRVPQASPQQHARHNTPE